MNLQKIQLTKNKCSFYLFILKIDQVYSVIYIYNLISAIMFKL